MMPIVHAALLILSLQAEPPRKGDIPVQVPEGWESKKQEGARTLIPKDLAEGKLYTALIPELTLKVGSLKGLIEAGKATLNEAGAFKPARDPAASRSEGGWE